MVREEKLEDVAEKAEMNAEERLRSTRHEREERGHRPGVRLENACGAGIVWGSAILKSLSSL